jgi:hypothetical protein
VLGGELDGRLLQVVAAVDPQQLPPAVEQRHLHAAAA